MKRSRRTERINGLLLQEISATVLRVVKDPRIRNVTFTAVDVTSDLRLARVHFSVLGDPRHQEEASLGLKSAKGVIKRELGRRMSLRYMPDLEFFYDPSIQYSEHIQNLLNKIDNTD